MSYIWPFHLIKKLVFTALASTLVFVVTYPVALTLEHYLESQDRISAKTYQLIKGTEKQRKFTQDTPEKLQLLSEGFLPLFKPNLLDTMHSGKESKFRKRLMEIVSKHRVLPLGAQPHTKVFWCNEGYGVVSYQTDRFGFRNADSIWDSNPEAVLIGDSFGQGACVPSMGETISGKLNSVFPTLNLSSSGNSPIIYAALTKIFIMRLQPKIVIMTFYENDNTAAYFDSEFGPYYSHFWLESDVAPFFNKANDGISAAHKRFFTDVNQHLVSYTRRRLLRDASKNASFYMSPYFKLSVEDLHEMAKAETPLYQPISSSLLKLPRLQSVLRSVNSSPTQLPFSTRLAIDELRSACKEKHCLPLVVYIPNSQLRRPNPQSYQYAELLYHYTRDNDVAFLDLTSALNKWPDSKVYAPLGPHLSKFGYHHATQHILDFLTEGGSLPLRP